MFVYMLLLITFILLPAAAFEYSKPEKFEVPNKVLLIVTGFFLLHNFCFLLGISLIGDYVDYIIFSLEYFFACYIMSTLFRKKNIAFKSVGILGLCIIGLGMIIGFFGILIFIVISQDYESNKIYDYESNSKTYQTRRYSFGFATLLNIKYSYDTYRTFAYIPIEYNIDSTSLLDTETNLRINSPHFNIAVTEDKIIFSSENGVKVSKKLD